MKSHFSISAVLASCLAAWSCQPGETGPRSALESIPPLDHSVQELAEAPFELFYMNSKDGAIWRCALDGTNPRLVLNPQSLAQSESRINASFQGRRGGLPAPRAKLGVRLGSPELHGVDDFIEISIEQAPSTPVPWEQLEVIQPDAPQRRGRPGAAEKPSPWTLTPVVGKETLEDSPLYCTVAFKIKHRDGAERSLDLSGAPTSRKEPLGIFGSRYLLLIFQPSVVIWDLKEDKKWKVLDAQDVVLFPVDPKRTEPFALEGEAVVMGQRYAWKPKGPEDLAPKPEYRVPERPIEK